MFQSDIVERVLVACGRCCCICHKFCGTKIELHHIVQKADEGADTFENCIPLCFDCHAEVKAYNPRHPKGRKFTEGELAKHRDLWYSKVANGINEVPSNSGSIIISSASLHRCSHCGFGYYIDINSLGKYAALMGATTSCPRCGNVDNVGQSIWNI